MTGAAPGDFVFRRAAWSSSGSWRAPVPRRPERCLPSSDQFSGPARATGPRRVLSGLPRLSRPDHKVERSVPDCRKTFIVVTPNRHSRCSPLKIRIFQRWHGTCFISSDSSRSFMETPKCSKSPSPPGAPSSPPSTGPGSRRRAPDHGPGRRLRLAASVWHGAGAEAVRTTMPWSRRATSPC